MTGEVIEYTYTTYQQPAIEATDFVLYSEFANILVTALRARGFLGNKTVGVFWCVSPSPNNCGVLFLLQVYDTIPDIWFGACEADGQKVTALRMWHVHTEQVNGLEWIAAPYGITPSGTIHPSTTPYSGDERVFGWCYNTHDTNWDTHDYYKVIFGFQQNSTDPGDLEYPTFILPPKSFFLEGMHMDVLPIADEIPLWVDYDDNGTSVHNIQFWQYKAIPSSN